MDIKDLLENETIKGLMDKIGVPPEKAEGFANQAMNSIKSNFDKDPKQMSSLLSENENTEGDMILSKEVEDDFVDRLIKKVGLPESVAGMAKSAIPQILGQFTNKLSSNGKNDEGGIAGMLGGITDMFGGDEGGSKKSGGFMSIIMGLLRGLFKKEK